MLLILLVIMVFQRGQYWKPKGGQTTTPGHTQNAARVRWSLLGSIAVHVCVVIASVVAARRMLPPNQPVSEPVTLVFAPAAPPSLPIAPEVASEPARPLQELPPVPEPPVLQLPLQTDHPPSRSRNHPFPRRHKPRRFRSRCHKRRHRYRRCPHRRPGQARVLRHQSLCRGLARRATQPQFRHRRKRNRFPMHRQLRRRTNRTRPSARVCKAL